jgi:hypothetical protein
MRPQPETCPQTLMSYKTVSTQPVCLGIRLFKSSQPVSFVQIKACSSPEQGWRQKVPTTSTDY